MERDIILIVLDSVRKDYFDKYAPRLQELADVSFEQCRAAGTHTFPAHGGMFTGKLPHQHGIHSYNSTFTGLKPEDTFLSELEGYHHLCVTSVSQTGPEYGFTELFDSYSAFNQHSWFPSGINMDLFLSNCEKDGFAKHQEFLNECFRHENTLQSVGNGVSTQLSGIVRDLPIQRRWDYGTKLTCEEIEKAVTDANEPFFLFGHFYESHRPFSPASKYDASIFNSPPDWSSHDLDEWEYNNLVLNNADIDENTLEDVRNYRQVYSATIEYTDRQVSSLIKRLQNSTSEQTTIVVVSDHGESLGFESDDYFVGHGSTLAESVLHVPLLLFNPPSGYDEQEHGLFSQMDLGELLIGLSKGETPDVFRNQVVAERVGLGQSFEVENREYWDRASRCVYEGSKKFVWDSLGNGMVYQLDLEDPCRRRIVQNENVSQPIKDVFDLGISD